MGFCTDAEYSEFMREAPEFERMLVRSGLHLTKFWFSVTRSEQRTRFIIRRVDPVRQWKLSPMDIESLDKWDAYTDAKEAMFHYTDSEHAPWTVVKSNDKKRARLEAIKHVLRKYRLRGQDRGGHRGTGQEPHRAGVRAVRAQPRPLLPRPVNQRWGARSPRTVNTSNQRDREDKPSVNTREVAGQRLASALATRVRGWDI